MPRVKLVNLHELLSHEEVIPPRVYKLALDILSRRLVLKPIIVEAKSYTIIDGHHRATALKMIGAKKAPVVEARYEVDIESVGSWSITLHSRNPWRAVEELESTGGGGEAVVVFNNHRLIIRVDPLEAQFKARELALEKQDANKTRILIKLPQLKPKDVVETGYSIKKLPARTTRHKTILKRIVEPTKLKELL